MLPSYLIALLATAGLAGQSSGIDFQSGPVRAVQDMTASATADDVEFIHFDFQRLGLYELTVHYGPIDGEPSIGVQYGVETSIEGEAALKDVGFDAIDPAGVTIQRLVVARQATGSPGPSEFLGLMTVPDRPFRIRLSGETIDGRRVRRIFQRRFDPTTPPPDDRPYLGLPPETAAALQRMFDAQAPGIVAERQALIAGHGSERIVLPRTIVSNVLYAPLLSKGGRPIGIRVTYEVTFSQSGQYTPALSIHAMRNAGTRANGMYILKSTIDPRPHAVQAPNHEAENVVGQLLQPATADFLYVGDKMYRFAVDLVPDSVRVDKRGTNLCSQPRALDRDAAATLAEPSTPDTQSSYRLSIDDQTYEGAIADFDDPATLYRNLMAEGLQSCQ
ncbi:MAG TPA: hypothetical protein VKB36_07395 [Vicinamibacterales bacterium]|nr:hypothetical protein [Vicinamibacterales bacterium]